MVLSKDQFLCYRHFVSIQEHPKTAKQDKDKVQNKSIYWQICIFPSKTVINTSHYITISKNVFFFFNSGGELACTADKISG